jgi:hypothetical protein
MKTRLPNATWALAVLSLLGAAGGCGDDDAGEGAEDEPTQQGVAAAQPGSGGATPQPLRLGQPPTSMEVPIPPSYDLEITEHGEYQIDVSGAPLDPEIFIYRDDTLVERNNDGGDGLDARVVRFLEPGTYSVRIVEHRARPFTAQVSARRLEPLEPVGSVTLGEPLEVTFPAIPLLRRPDDDRDAAKAVTLEIEAAGRYTCTASADNGRDAKMAIIRDGRVLAEDDDSGGNNTAAITEELEPGRYVIRVWDWIRRGDTHITVTCRRG